MLQKMQDTSVVIKDICLVHIYTEKTIEKQHNRMQKIKIQDAG